MSTYRASDELSFAIRMTKLAMEEQHAKVIKMVSDLSDEQNWMDGHVAEEVTHLASLVTQLFALRRAMRMLNKQENEE
jgi:hypothetical protein